MYHSNALLLPDGTVAVVGGNPTQGAYEPHIEIYSPAYLFNVDGRAATRPSIASAPATVTYGSTFQVQTAEAADIASVVLMRPGAPTHAFDMDQRLVRVSYSVGSGVLNVIAPPNGSVAPPGYYMLFVLNSAGVPSVARFVQLTANFSLSATPASQTVLPGDGASYTATVSGGSGFADTVTDGSGSFSAPRNFTVGGLPSGTTASFTNPSVNGAGTTTLTVSTSLATPLGTHQFVITGDSRGVVQRTSITLVVGPSMPSVGQR